MLKVFTTAAAALALTACAGIGSLSSAVSTYGPWPAERKPTSYAFERLPSQQEHYADRQQRIEDAARGAIEAAGFTPAATPAEAQVKVQVGARVGIYDRWPYYDPFWHSVSVGASFGHRRGFGRSRLGVGFGWGYYDDYASYEREVAVLIRDQGTGQLLYEARASNSGVSSSIDPLMPAMFAAAMKDFPAGGPNPRNVNVELSKQ